MYFDSSSNPITAMDMVETLLAPLQQQLCAPMSGHLQAPGISTESYNYLVRCYNALLQESHQCITGLQLQLLAAKAENLRLQAQLLRKSRT